MFRYLALEIRRTYRNKRFLLMTLALPLVLFEVNARLYGDSSGPQGISATAYLMVSMAVLGGMTSAMSTGAGISEERKVGWNRQLRLTPLRPMSYLLAKGAVSMLLAVPAISLVYLEGLLVEHVSLSPQQWAVSLAGLWLAVIPFAVLGQVIGYVSAPDSSSVIFSATFLVLSLFGGVFVPVEIMPSAMAQLAEILPSYWLGIVGRSPLGTGGFDWWAVVVLLAWTVGLAAVVARKYRADMSRA
ncbi:MAG TPA: ABC transporter permease [Actinopolymorphaceae bacterium]|jgi:ABC-2 type transport system permease protein